MSLWIPCTSSDVVVGDAIALSGTDPTGDRWHLSGRVRARGDGTGSLLVEWTTLTGDGDPPWPLWSTQLVRRHSLASGDLRRHRDHGPSQRTDEAGVAYLRRMRNDGLRCKPPNGMRASCF